MWDADPTQRLRAECQLGAAVFPCWDVSRLSQHPAVAAPISQAPPGHIHPLHGRSVAAPDEEKSHQPGAATPNLDPEVQTFNFLPRNSPNRAPRATSRNRVLILEGFTDDGGSSGGKDAAPKLRMLVWSCPIWDSPSWEPEGASELCSP